MSLQKIAILSVLVALTVVLEQVLYLLPSIQVTTILIVLMSTSFDKTSNVLAIIAYVTLDNILGGFTFLYPFMLISWLLFMFVINMFRNKNEFVLALISFIFGLIHMVFLGIPNILILRLDPRAYFLADIIFTLVFMLTNFLTVLWFYKPLKRILDDLFIKKL